MEELNAEERSSGKYSSWLAVRFAQLTGVLLRFCTDWPVPGTPYDFQVALQS